MRLIEQSARTKIKKAKLPTRDEVKKEKEDEIIANLEHEIKERKHTEYLPMTKELSLRYPPHEVVAAALSIILGNMEFDDMEEPGTESTSYRTGFVRPFMTIGRKDKIKVGDIVKSTSAGADIPAKKIENIALFDTFSFVEVPANLADRVISAINDIVMHGRKVRVRHAKEKRK